MAMELMQINLTEKLKENRQESYFFLIDIMSQIAKEMYHLHDMHIVI